MPGKTSFFILNDTTLANNWRVVQKFEHRHIFYMDEIEDELIDEEDT